MRIGVTLPQREIAIGTDVGAVREFAQAAESIGYTYLRTGEHVLGANVASRPNWRGPYGHTDLWHEPFVLFGYLAGITQTLELVTSILILPQRQTALVAKQAAEVDVLSGGRLRLGIGVGWNDVEYEALGQDFRDRGQRCEEQIEVLRALWTSELVTYEGRWHKITDAGLNPMPVQRPIPIWIGGGPGSAGTISAAGSERVLKRIARMADGWFPSVGLQSNVGGAIARLHELMRDAGRDPSSVEVEGSVSAADRGPEEWAQQAAAWKEVGATHITVSTAGAGYSTSREHIEALERVHGAVANVLG